MFLIDDILELLGMAATTAAPEVAVGTSLLPEITGGLGALGTTGEALSTLGGLGSLGSMAPGAGALLYEGAGVIPAMVTEMGPASVSAFTNTLATGGTQLEAMTAAQSAAVTSGITGSGAGMGAQLLPTAGTSSSIVPSAGAVYSDAMPGAIVDMGGGQMGTVSNSGLVIPNTPGGIASAPTEGLMQTSTGAVQNTTNPAVTEVGKSAALKDTGAYSKAFSRLGGNPNLISSGIGSGSPYVAPQFTSGLNIPSMAETQGLAYSPTLTPGGAAQQALLNANATPLASTPQSGGIMDTVTKFAKDNPFMTGMAAYTLASKSGLFDPSKQYFNQDQGSPYLNSFRLSKNFQGAPTPTTMRPSYTPRYAEGGIASMAMGGQPGQMYPQSMQEHTNFATSSQYPTSAQQVTGYEPTTNPMNGEPLRMASGGIASFAGGGQSDMSAFNYFMQQAKGEPDTSRFPTKQFVPDKFVDDNPNTKYEDAWNAAAIRQATLNKRANMQSTGSSLGRLKGLGNLDLGPVGDGKKKQGVQAAEPEYAAHGGLMGHLGSFAQGGSPRMLKGPGDGMSDSIPATIGGVQPARLADGEFVVPADVVSHLGNGSSDAGAKKLYGMMDKVRKARTGKKKQAPEVNADKYMPKR